MFMLNLLSKTHLACHNNGNGFKAGSNSNMTDKHAAECSIAAYLGIKQTNSTNRGAREL